ncbi:MFS transporter [Streptomonospora salina]|uniref:Putative MFS family arabinose efflux permease n=2 Tax=Streptomonospora salina TaxID=104205 RepID=A0A841E567_9ACTN|nr:MFS transporter [Streptomonospora salina]MBB5997594.1 putative MFS family arabinose efflux permease [Streptomonospora salina]
MNTTAPRSHLGLNGWAFRLLILATGLTFAGFVLLLPVVPLWAARGGAGEVGAGATTSVFMLTTVLTQLAMPWLLDHGGYRWTFPVGALLLGVPAPLLLATADIGPLLAVSAVRGIGFGMATVAGSALAARLVPPEQLGRATGYYGLAVGVPNVFFLSTGVWAALNLGFAAVFWIAAAGPVLGAAAAAGIWILARDETAGDETAGAAAPAADRDGAGGAAPAGLRLYAALGVPLVAMLVPAVASSAIVTFLSIPLSESSTTVFTALLAFGVLAVCGRWAAGTLSDRHRRPVLLVYGSVAAVAGIACTAAALWPAGGAWSGPGPLGTAAAVAGAGLFGAGFGAVQNDTIVIMFRRAGSRAYGTASAVWNIGYDAGTGLGSLILGVVIQTAGYGPAFAAMGAVLAACLPAAVALARRPRRVRGRSGGGGPAPADRERG